MKLKKQSTLTLACILAIGTHHATASSDGIFLSGKQIASTVTSDDYFGAHIAIDGDLAVIGSPQHNNQGAAYVYRYMNGTWTEVLKLQPSDLDTNDGFGWAVDVDATSQTVAIGALWQDEHLPDGSVLSDVGSAYAYQLDFSSAVPSYTEYKLISGVSGGDRSFGHSVSLDGNRLLIGSIGMESNAPGLVDDIPARAYYLADFQDQIINFEIVAEHDAESQFGYHVSLSNDNVIIGAPGDDDKGAVYVYKKDATTFLWEQEQRIEANDAQVGDFFGSYADVDDTRLIIGAPMSANNTGAAYLYEPDLTNWQFDQKFVDNNGSPGRFFSTSVGVDGDSLLIGSQNSNNTGEAFLYRYQGGNWNDPLSLTPEDVGSSMYGFSGDISGQFTIIGDLQNNNIQGNNAGAIYIFADDIIFVNGLD